MATCILGQYNIPFVCVTIICFLCWYNDFVIVAVSSKSDNGFVIHGIIYLWLGSRPDCNTRISIIYLELCIREIWQQNVKTKADLLCWRYLKTNGVTSEACIWFRQAIYCNKKIAFGITFCFLYLMLKRLLWCPVTYLSAE